MKTETVCGTYAGYQRHARRRENACDECKAAARDYMRDFRSRPGNREREREGNRAATRALWALANRHEAEYRALYAQQLAAERT